MSDKQRRPADMVGVPVPCLGWLGKVFGHKFRTWDGDATDPITCFRCGTPAGLVVEKASVKDRKPPADPATATP